MEKEGGEQIQSGALTGEGLVYSRYMKQASMAMPNRAKVTRANRTCWATFLLRKATGLGGSGGGYGVWVSTMYTPGYSLPDAAMSTVISLPALPSNNASNRNPSSLKVTLKMVWIPKWPKRTERNFLYKQNGVVFFQKVRPPDLWKQRSWTPGKWHHGLNPVFGPSR